MKRVLIIIIMLISTLTVFTGCDLIKKNNENNNETTTTKASIVNKQYEVGNLRYKVPDIWYYKKSKGFEYFYPNEDDRNIFLMVYYSESEFIGIEKETFDSFVDGIVEGFTTSDNMSLARVNSKEITQNGDFYYATVDVKANYMDSYREFILYVVFDNKTGVTYVFSFTSIENISDENKDIFNDVIKSIELR